VAPHKAYVEDAPEEDQLDSHSTVVEEAMPSAPSPPPAVPGFSKSQDPVNVFDFLVDTDTPNGSKLELTAPEQPRMIKEAPKENHDRGLVKVRFERAGGSITDLVEYGSGPVYPDNYRTPAPKSEREQRKEKKHREHSRDGKSDKKRKRLHVDTQDLSSRGDQVMTDAPPILHSGLTGGLKGLLSRPSVFPPSPDYSGGDFDASPGSPLKKTKHSRRDRERSRGRVDTISNNIMSLITSTPSREPSEDRPRRKKHHRRREESERPARKLIEYIPATAEHDHDSSLDSQGQMVVFQPRAELLLSFVNKGPESERGVSMNKALKRYHRERHASGASLPRADEEKELWRSLRMKRNERGEIVLFL
jgi:cell growth-regulating nucleolar protein